LGAQVTGLGREGGLCRATLMDGTQITADRVVLALPPRVAAQLTFTPALPAAALHALESVPTWMAGQAKAVALYDTPFWRHAGLSGDASSRRGPLVEIHDASPDTGGPYALFGFIGIPPEARGQTEPLQEAIIAQLVRLFGPEAATPRQLLLKDWARDPMTATAADAAPLYAHPTYGPPPHFGEAWDGGLHLSGSETARMFGGYLEGALEAAEQTAVALTSTPHKTP
jgi:monoamine oxidase